MILMPTSVAAMSPQFTRSPHHAPCRSGTMQMGNTTSMELDAIYEAIDEYTDRVFVTIKKAL